MKLLKTLDMMLGSTMYIHCKKIIILIMIILEMDDSYAM